MRSDCNNHYIQTSNYMVNNLVNNMSCYSVTNVIQPNNFLEASQIKIELELKELWQRFNHLTNEMILTKAGRRTFPVIKINVTGLDESALYTIQIEFRFSDNYKYRFVNGEWKTSPRNDNFKNAPPTITYEHPDSPNFGHHWSKSSISFTKLKLTNNENTKNSDAVFLKSLNKYDPVIHIYKHDKKNVDDKVLIYSKFFQETQFIAVTAYQNQQITDLKIQHNPFAKAFQNNKPIITIENDKIITTEPVKRERSPSPSNELNKIQNQLQIQHKQHTFNNMSNNNTNFMIQNLTPKNEQTNASIPNWYNYYNQTSPIQSNNVYQYQHQTNIYQPQMYDSFNSANTQMYKTYANYQNEFAYQQPQYNFYNAYQQEQFNLNQQYYPIQYDYNNLQDSNDLTERSKQSSPIYDTYHSTIKKSQEVFRQNRAVPYTTSRPAKRQAVQSDDLPVSPVYGSQILRPESNEQSDDSLNSSENFLNQLHNQTNHSASSSSSASFTLSSSSAST